MSQNMSHLLRVLAAGGVQVDNPDFTGGMEVDNPLFRQRMAPPDSLGPERRRLLEELHGLVLQPGEKRLVLRVLGLMERWAEIGALSLMRDPFLTGPELDQRHRVANGLWLGVAHAREVLEHLDTLLDDQQTKQREQP